MSQPVNVATPATAARELDVVQAKVAAPGTVIANATLLVSPTTVLPAPSCTVTTGGVPKSTPPFAPTGCVVNASFAASPAAITTLLLTAGVNGLSVAVRVYVFDLSILQPANVARPAT